MTEFGKLNEIIDNINEQIINISDTRRKTIEFNGVPERLDVALTALQEARANLEHRLGRCS